MSTSQIVMGRKVHLLDALNALSNVGMLVESVFMMAFALHHQGFTKECEAFQRVAEVAHDEIRRIREALSDLDHEEGE